MSTITCQTGITQRDLPVSSCASIGTPGQNPPECSAIGTTQHNPAESNASRATERGPVGSSANGITQHMVTLESNAIAGTAEQGPSTQPHQSSQQLSPSSPPCVPEAIDGIVTNVVEHLKVSNCSNPVEMLRYLQGQVVTGRSLDVEDPALTLEGETNFILVSRENLMETAFDEIRSLNDLRLTLEVQFYHEVFFFVNEYLFKNFV